MPLYLSMEYFEIYRGSIIVRGWESVCVFIIGVRRHEPLNTGVLMGKGGGGICPQLKIKNASNVPPIITKVCSLRSFAFRVHLIKLYTVLMVLFIFEVRDYA